MKQKRELRRQQGSGMIENMHDLHVVNLLKVKFSWTIQIDVNYNWYQWIMVIWRNSERFLSFLVTGREGCHTVSYTLAEPSQLLCSAESDLISSHIVFLEVIFITVLVDTWEWTKDHFDILCVNTYKTMLLFESQQRKKWTC